MFIVIFLLLMRHSLNGVVSRNTFRVNASVPHCPPGFSPFLDPWGFGGILINGCMRWSCNWRHMKRV